MTQNKRVLRALRRHPQGICQGDFFPPNVLDGGYPITRLAARIKDLREQGHEIEVDGERWGYAVYKLAQARQEREPVPPAEMPAIPVDENAKPDALFDMPTTLSPYSTRDAA
jgi:hypothetical protein